LILSTLLLLLLFASSAYSQSAADAARAERAAWASADPNAKILNTPIGSSDSSGASNPQQTGNMAKNQTENQTVTPQPIVTDVTNATIPKKFESIPVSGNWSLEIADNTSRNATLTIFQSDDTVFGKGNLKANNDTITVTACGSVAGNKLNIGLVTLEKIGLYQLSMAINGNSTTGNYTAFRSTGSTSTGTVKGIRLSPHL
jgi:hypothetical protein